jgi:hypothetical protein
MRGTTAKNKDNLKSDRKARAAANPVAQQDQFGSHHNEDNIKKEQRRKGRTSGQNLAQRESGQDTQRNRGGANKQPGSRTRKSGSAERGK